MEIDNDILVQLRNTIKNLMSGKDGLPKKSNTQFYNRMVKDHGFILIRAFVSEFSPYEEATGGSYESYEYVGDSILKTIINLISIQLYPDSTPQQLTEMNAYLGSATIQAQMFDKMQLHHLYIRMEDPALIEARGNNPIPTYIKSDIFEALMYSLKIVLDAIGLSGNNICTNIISSYLPNRISYYRRNGGWKSLINQAIGKSYGGSKNGNPRYPVKIESVKGGGYKGTITLTQNAIDDISSYAHNDEFNKVTPAVITATSETTDDVNNKLYERLFMHIVNAVGYQWMQNYRRHKTLNDKNNRFLIDNNFLSSIRVNEKSLKSNVYTVTLEYNSLAPELPYTRDEMLDSIRNDPDIDEDDYKRVFYEMDSDPTYGRESQNIYYKSSEIRIPKSLDTTKMTEKDKTKAIKDVIMKRATGDAKRILKEILELKAESEVEPETI